MLALRASCSSVCSASQAAAEFALQIALEGLAIDALGQLQVDARQLAEATEAPLQRADVHHRQALAGARAPQAAGHPQRDVAAAGAQHQRCARLRR